MLYSECKTIFFEMKKKKYRDNRISYVCLPLCMLWKMRYSLNVKLFLKYIMGFNKYEALNII